MAKTWTADAILELVRAYQPGLVLMAAAELDLFAALQPRPRTSAQVAAQRAADPRGLAMLMDALTALGFLSKKGARYALNPGVADCLTEDGRTTVLAMTRHQATCARRWIQLAAVVKSGQPAQRTASIRGAASDHASFITAMDNLAAPNAAALVAQIKGLKFRTLLDVGGASGSWTIAFLRAYPNTSAILYDLPAVVPMARQRIGAVGLLPRVKLVPGDFYQDPLPAGADLAWISAIVHQNSRAQNRTLFAKVHQALVPGGQILIRDIVMDPSRTRPVNGALFAINMLCGPHEGGTFTLNELAQDLKSVGFTAPRLIRKDVGMNALVAARKKK